MNDGATDLVETLIGLFDALVARVGLPMTIVFALLALLLFSGGLKITLGRRNNRKE